MGYRLARTNEEKGYEIIKVYEENGKLYADCRKPCERCGGVGKIPYFGHIDGGVCFKCGGNPWSYSTFRAYTEEERAKLDAAYQKKVDKKIADLEAASEVNKKAWMEKYGFGADGIIFIVAGGNTYNIKDALKDAGARFYQGIGWFFTSQNEAAANLPEGYFLYKTDIDTVFDWVATQKKMYFKTGALDAIEKGIKDAIVARNEKNSKSRWYGTVGDRIKKQPAVFKEVKSINNEWGGSLLYTFAIGDDVFTWFTQSVIDEDINPGDNIILSGTIKSHTEYGGVLQTQLNRCIVKRGE